MADTKAHDAIAPADDTLGQYPSNDGPVSDNSMEKIIQKARAATEKERQMGMWKGIKIYPKAVAWSILISTCIAMEGYDISLVNNFYAFPQFNRKYGELQSNGSYQVPARVSYEIYTHQLWCSSCHYAANTTWRASSNFQGNNENRKLVLIRDIL